MNKNNHEYVSQKRLISYYNQSRIIRALGNEVNTILEVGIYNSFLSKLLNPYGYSITTADADPELNPDILLDLTKDIELPQDTFDVIALFQVLEHIPYEIFEKVLVTLSQTTKKYLVISLPFYSYYIMLQVQSNFLLKRTRSLVLQIPKFWTTIPFAKEHHYWEIGLKGYPLQRIRNSFKQSGLTIKREYQDPLNAYHYFFVLEKTSK
ncbi:methyltransferase domain-containing protein [Spirulina sp. CS-785/01]|uniref:class I SAM-dependent methyltransferase n=1 Tax=Spirulina sp. CS-785/01 TaxID=3021716 RepID=UPI00232FF35F|nr:methyltransferase domain-containing protein [Spirulina sp. CS-785/01]MDB9314588.1 methyltransferase domain-containing protein [Spirulina sp. CS-785/01]